MKTYVKPDLFFESFELSQSIAACGYDVNFASIETCETYTDESIYYETVLVFTADGNCVHDVEADYCYMTGAQTDATKLFRS